MVFLNHIEKKIYHDEQKHNRMSANHANHKETFQWIQQAVKVVQVRFAENFI